MSYLLTHITYRLSIIAFFLFINVSFAQETPKDNQTQPEITSPTQVTNTELPQDEPLKKTEQETSELPVLKKEKKESLLDSLNSDEDEEEESQKKKAINIDADTVDYSMSEKNVSASGNVIVIYGGAKITCQKITVNTETKEGLAEGGVKLVDDKGTIEAEKMSYNFEKKTGIMYDALFRANPYYGRSKEMKKVSETEFIGYNTELSTCDYDHPHYRIKTKMVDFFRDDKVKMKSATFTVGQDRQVPLLHLPFFNRSLKKPFMHVQFTPGKRKDWGYYMLTAWRYRINDFIDGDIFVDYRQNFGNAQGFETRYLTPSNDFGKGTFKFYYTQERDKSKDLSASVDVPKVFERYLIRWRHKWAISEKTSLISEYYRITDSKRAIHGSKFNFLKDYFFREYEKDEQPLSYVQISHLFDNSSLNILVQPRTNRWYSQLEKIPEMVYTMPSMQMWNSRFYFEDYSTFANYNNKHAVPSPSTDDLSMWRFDSINKFSLPFKASIFQLKPYVGNRTTYYDCDNNGAAILPRTIFMAGSDISTKFYRLFNVKTNFLGLDVNDIRHIITPVVTYNFQNTPTVPNTKLKQIDSVDSINGVTNSAGLQLSNKLQTKRDGQTIDLADFRIETSYNFKSHSNKTGGGLSDFLLYLDLLPYSWMTLHADANFTRGGNHFSKYNFDIGFNFTSERRIGFGYRYLRKESKELVTSGEWRFTPKWKGRAYARYQFGNGLNLSSGMREIELGVIRDMHCWETEFTWNHSISNGDGVWVIFRMKAFPELQFEFDQTYHQPKPGSQINQ